MSDPLTAPQPSAFHFPPQVSVVCPKCGQLSAFPFVTRYENEVEYRGICGAVYEPRAHCDAVLKVRVASHQFPA